jgi:ribulose-phosphate 3-epimerase
MNEKRVVPAILTEDAQKLAQMVRLAEGFASWVQFDIMDGLFVPSKSLSVPEIASSHPGIPWEAHLMVRTPAHYFEGLQLAGARRIIFHEEASFGPSDIAIKIERIHNMGMQAGLAINPSSPVSVVNHYFAADLDCVLLLAVEPGFYGSPFIPEVLQKVPELRANYPRLVICLDGGVKAHNIAEVAGSGVDEICVGSAIFNQADPAAAFNELTLLAQRGWADQTR